MVFCNVLGGHAGVAEEQSADHAGAIAARAAMYEYSGFGVRDGTKRHTHEMREYSPVVLPVRRGIKDWKANLTKLGVVMIFRRCVDDRELGYASGESRTRYRRSSAWLSQCGH